MVRGGPQVNKFEQVCDDDRQRSVAAEGRGRYLDPMSGRRWRERRVGEGGWVGAQVWSWGGKTLPIPYDVPTPALDRPMLVKTLPSHNFVCGRWQCYAMAERRIQRIQTCSTAPHNPSLWTKWLTHARETPFAGDNKVLPWLFTNRTARTSTPLGQGATAGRGVMGCLCKRAEHWHQAHPY